ncbi:hypothetical protein KEM55_008744 [Ascosphaera atra]|nr:hypothetical protein KEM55_008744 [Ascosphaera atra]
MDIDSSPQVEEHHQFGGSLEIGTMLPPASPFPFTMSPPRKELPVVEQCLNLGNETADLQENSSIIRGQESPGIASITESLKESLHLRQEGQKGQDGQEGQESIKRSASRRSDKPTQHRRKKRKREIPIVWDEDEGLPP